MVGLALGHRERLLERAWFQEVVQVARGIDCGSPARKMLIGNIKDA
jgi:hypothetical protein